ncbi:spore germination protein GerW family protein [Streptomyces jumonjinensis]|uniref:Sporulation protein n=1 Tax=Streptomyces jumonjinensis TaxID=1945 RepID=A0A646KQP7_STRJU|nr:spore germination protein GerW family protein [Streptomyces jumonjinensis]MQT04420.1 sporulation protein [Streptomyces jumonjinensis]
MTDPENTTTAVGGTVRATTDLLERLAERLGGKASVTAVFGEPIVGEGVTVIPVAAAGFGFGGGAGHETGAARTSEGGGGGGGGGAKPLGFIELRDGRATYKPIRDPWAEIALSLTVVVAGVLAPRAARAIAARRRRT